MAHHVHHCAACIYLGYEGPRTDEERKAGGYVDLYVHNGWRAGVGTFTRRWSDHQYAEVPIAIAEGPHWEVVRLAAIKKGALKS
jgi:hypothetical protein